MIPLELESILINKITIENSNRSKRKEHRTTFCTKEFFDVATFKTLEFHWGALHND